MHEGKNRNLGNRSVIRRETHAAAPRIAVVTSYLSSFFASILIFPLLDIFSISWLSRRAIVTYTYNNRNLSDGKHGDCLGFSLLSVLCFYIFHHHTFVLPHDATARNERYIGTCVVISNENVNTSNRLRKKFINNPLRSRAINHSTFSVFAL